jgi:hypothetical protein
VTPRTKKLAWAALWIALAVPALWQLGLMARAIAGRFAYPYDLEWMEGGLLQHAQRITDGQGLYVAPSIDFIPYLYTPLYPGLISLLGSAFGITYQLGRALSILALLGITALAIAAIVRWRPRILQRFAIVPSSAPTMGDAAGRGPRWVGAALAVGVFAAGYPYVEGWYDLVRADTLFLFLITAGVLAASRWARAGVGGNGDALMMALGAILTLAFFTKQTGVIYVLWSGVIIVAAWVPDFAPPGKGRRVMRLAAIIGAVAVVAGVVGGLVAGWKLGALVGVGAFVAVNGVMLAIAGRRPAVKGSLRRITVYGLTAAVIGLGGVFMLDRVTHHWFWIYTFEIHQVHDFGWHRFWESFGFILWHHPALTISIGVTLVAVIATAIFRPASPGRRMPTGSGAFLLWTSTYAVSTLVGAVGYATEFAHFNAFMPALLHGALAVGAAVPALAGCARAWTGERPSGRYAPTAAAVAVALAVGITLVSSTWNPAKYIPRDADAAAGDALIKRIAAVEGDVWVPNHPWYAHLAGKRMFAHRMGIKDVTARKPRPIAGLDASLRNHRFAAIFLDINDLHQEVPGFRAAYRTDIALPGRERPRVYTGAPAAVPEAVWIPAVKEKPPFGVRVLFDFETGRYDGWEIQGDAWGRAPVNGAVQGQAVVGGYGGRFFATSMSGGEKATGTLISQPFVIEGNKISLRVGGGISDDLRVELRIDGRMVRRAVASSPVGERLTVIEWDVADLRELTARIAAVDNNATNSWAHLNFDEIWLWP